MAPKQKPNGFLLFMREFKKREEARGRVFRNGLKDVQADAKCNQEWQALSQEARTDYNQRAKRSVQDSKKKTGAGECMSDVEKQKTKKIEFESNMNDEIESVIANGMEFDILPREKFHFIHSNWFYTRLLEDSELDYIPAEFAVAEFSLEFGVTNVYHEILKTDVRVGYAREAKETSQETHQLPCNLPSAEDRYEVMCEKLLKFLSSNKRGGKFPPLYTSRKINAPVKSLLKRMMESLSLPDETLVVYDLEVLFMHFRNAAAEKNNLQDNFRVVMAEYELIKDSYSFVPGLDCEYHKSVDGTSQFCSLSNVKRWAFTICDYCCENFGIKLLAGVHYPLQAPIVIDQSDSLSTQLNKLAIQESIGIKSMTGVSNEHRQKVSERSDKEEQLRRKDKTPITIIDHSQKNSRPSTSKPPASTDSGSEAYQRPLRPPNTKSHAIVLGNKNEHSYNESDFPSLGISAGRGKGSNKHNENKPGRGRGIAFALS